MPRASFQTAGIADLSGGINQRETLALPNELRDAQNVWWRDGICQQRPGFQGYLNPAYTIVSNTTVFVSESPLGTFTTYVSGTFVLNGNLSDRLYIGFTTGFCACQIPTNPNNTNNTTAYAEYWNGSTWVFLPSWRHSKLSITDTTKWNAGRAYVLGSSDQTQAEPTFVPPFDWATTSVNGSTQQYFVRFSFKGAALSSGTAIVNVISLFGNTTNVNYQGLSNSSTTVGAWLTYPYNTQYGRNSYFTVGFPEFLNSSGFVAGKLWQGQNDIIAVSLSPSTSFGTPSIGAIHTGQAVTYSSAANPINGDFIIAANDMVFELRPSQSNLFQVAQVETDPIVVGLQPDGSQSTYNPALVPQQAAVPTAKFWAYFGSAFFCAGITGLPQQLQWSAAYASVNGNRVWPLVNTAFVIGNDTSPITGLGTIGETLVCYKFNSIWNVLDKGPDPTTLLNVYVPVKTVSGIGCVAHNSIQELNGAAYFLGHDGVYRYDGQGAQCISDDILPLIRSITTGRRELSCSAKMQTEDAYFLAVPTNANQYNDTILVYRISNRVYSSQWGESSQKQGSWWRWTLPANIFAVCMWTEVSKDQGEQLFFQDQAGNVYVFVQGYPNDNGATINAYVTTHDFLRDRGLMQSAVRGVIVGADASAKTLAVNVIPDGQQGYPVQGTITMTGTVASTNPPDVAPDGFRFSTNATPDNLGYGDIRERRINFWKECKRFRVQIQNNVKNQIMKLRSVLAYYNDKGKR